MGSPLGWFRIVLFKIKRSWRFEERCTGRGPIDTSPHFFIVSNHEVLTMLLLGRGLYPLSHIAQDPREDHR